MIIYYNHILSAISEEEEMVEFLHKPVGIRTSSSRSLMHLCNSINVASSNNVVVTDDAVYFFLF